MPRRSPCHALGPIVALTLAVAACGDASLPVAPNSTSSAPPQFAKAPARPTGTGIGVISSRMDRTHQPVEYHGGRMMMSTTHVYLIWYGGWGTSITPSIVTDLVSSLGGSNYFQAVTLYRNPNGIGPSNSVQYAGAYYDSYSRGATISNIDVAMIAASAVASGNLPPDPDGVYVVLPTADVNETSGFGTAYCGFHSLTNANDTTLQTLFVGHPGRVPSKCLPQMVSPNGDVGADAIASVLVAAVQHRDRPRIHRLVRQVPPRAGRQVRVELRQDVHDGERRARQRSPRHA